MNPYKTETNRATANTSPIFASVWLTLFNQLRKNQLKRRLVNAKMNAFANPKSAK